MTFQIARSVINTVPYGYADAVEKFRQAKLAHRFTGDVAPSAPAIIEQAVRRVPVQGQADDFVADYQIIEDVPVPTLADRKAALAGTIRTMEAAALAKIISPGRERLMGFDLNACTPGRRRRAATPTARCWPRRPTSPRANRSFNATAPSSRSRSRN
jgi:hypothetical protein